jgi:hypothetical protein
MARKAAKTAKTKLPTPAKRPRTVFHVVPHGDGWAGEVEGRVIDLARVKGNLVVEYRLRCEGLKTAGVLCQIVLHKRDGKVEKEWTYGEDPRNVKG